MKLKKPVLIAIIAAIVVVIGGGAVLAIVLTSGNSNNKSKYDQESRPLVFSIGALDNNFNPFFSTSANDGAVAGMTQIGMLTTDKDGNPACGQNEACVALDYKSTMYTQDGTVTTNGDMASITEYEFVIKNGIKFSDGEDLTILDVLFNLYVYLDPMYTGSSTIYSTDIQGLKAYRVQDPDLADDGNNDTTSKFYAEAYERINNIKMWCDSKNTKVFTNEELAQIQSDIVKIRGLFKEEVTSDWNNIEGSINADEDEYGFTEDWQTYYLNEGIISVLTEKNTNGATVRRKKTVVDSTGKPREVYMTSLDDENNEYRQLIESYISTNLNKYMADNNCDADYARKQLMKEYAINVVYNNYMSEDESLLKSSLPSVLTYWGTATTALEDFMAAARSDYYDKVKNENAGSLMVPTISGITTYRTDNFAGKSLGASHDVLKIVINRVDPKAIWNFAFTVAPMHYYSNKEQTDLAKADYDKYKQDPANNQITHFGVDFGNKNFFDNVLKDTEKNGLPVGAGTYKASNSRGTTPTRLTFCANNMVFYERNEYFYTVGTGLSNAKIKYLNYKVVSEDNLMNALVSGGIDIGEPGATTKNISEISKYRHLSYKQQLTGGYGYVGINPKYIPEVEVRRAIMKAMNSASIIKQYYTEALASVIYRPMSKTSWAYPENATEYESIAYYNGDNNEIIKLVESAGYTIIGDDGVRRNPAGDKLKFTFTIAGETTDHPAYAMFVDAEKVLEECGFEITVQNDIQALRKLATGSLEVWAAAWGSGIDPDMYQVYHKDSTATSVNNWGYKEILNNQDKHPYEYRIINELSEKIDAARATLNQNERKQIYAEALDLVMDLAVEFPTYQRNDLTVYNNNVIDSKSLNQNPTLYTGLTHELWNVRYVQA